MTSTSRSRMLPAVPDVDAEFGRRLRRARVAVDLSQDDVARAVGLSRTSITNIEAGRQRVGLSQLYALATAVHCQPADLLPDMAQTGVAIPGLETELARRNLSREFASVANSIMKRAYAESSSGTPAR